MRGPTVTRSTRSLLVVVALLALATSASAQVKPGAGDPYAPTVLEEGKGWKLIETYDRERSERQQGHLVWMVMCSAVANLPVSAYQRDALEASFARVRHQ